jgi:hypothetical protein
MLHNFAPAVSQIRPRAFRNQQQINANPLQINTNQMRIETIPLQINAKQLQNHADKRKQRKSDANQVQIRCKSNTNQNVAFACFSAR